MYWVISHEIMTGRNFGTRDHSITRLKVGRVGPELEECESIYLKRPPAITIDSPNH